MLVDVHEYGECLLAFAVDAVGLPAFFFCRGEGGKKEGGQNSDDGNDDEQFDERESRSRSRSGSAFHGLILPDFRKKASGFDSFHTRFSGEFSLGVFNQFLDSLRVGFGMAVTADGIASPGRFYQDLRPDE